MSSSLNPVECHLFSLRGTAVTYPLAHSKIDRVISGVTFGATWCPSTRVQQQANVLKNQTSVRMAWEETFAWQYRECAPDYVVDYVRYRLFDSGWKVTFIGEVCGVKFKQEGRGGPRYVEVTMQPVSAVVESGTLCQRFGRQCGVPLYSAGCGVNRDDHKVTGLITTVTGNTIVSSDLIVCESTSLEGGDIVVNNRRRKIVYHDETTIIIASRIPNLKAGQMFTVWRGCDHRKTTCNLVFNNLDNFRGQEQAPNEDPWGERFG